jgi:anti-anti-sigma regulatory factor
MKAEKTIVNWEIQQGQGFVLVTLGELLGIQDASNFHEALLGQIKNVQYIKINASKVKELHTSILQILASLSKSVRQFELIEASDRFCEIERRFGYTLARNVET